MVAGVVLTWLVRWFGTSYYKFLRCVIARGKTGNAVWQRGYYEHVVRNENELNRIREYVSSNPLAWHLDKENPDRIGDVPFDLWLESLTKRVPAGPGEADRSRA